MPRRRTSLLVTLFGTSPAFWGRSRMCPTLAFTTYWSRPRKPSIVFALAFDSTMTSGLATLIPAVLSVVRSAIGIRAPSHERSSVVARPPCPGHRAARVLPRRVRPCQLRAVRVSREPACNLRLRASDTGAQPGSEGDPQLAEPLRRDRADPDHLRRDRSPHRLLPARRFAA